MGSRDVDCPVCGAPKGERCRGSAYSGRSHRTVDYHYDRRQAGRDSGPLGHRQQDPRCRGGGWHPPRDPAPDPATHGSGRPWRGARYSDDTPKEAR